MQFSNRQILVCQDIARELGHLWANTLSFAEVAACGRSTEEIGRAVRAKLHDNNTGGIVGPMANYESADKTVYHQVDSYGGLLCVISCRRNGVFDSVLAVKIDGEFQARMLLERPEEWSNHNSGPWLVLKTPGLNIQLHPAAEASHAQALLRIVRAAYPLVAVFVKTALSQYRPSLLGAGFSVSK